MIISEFWFFFSQKKTQWNWTSENLWKCIRKFSVKFLVKTLKMPFKMLFSKGLGCGIKHFPRSIINARSIRSIRAAYGRQRVEGRYVDLERIRANLSEFKRTWALTNWNCSLARQICKPNRELQMYMRIWEELWRARTKSSGNNRFASGAVA